MCIDFMICVLARGRNGFSICTDCGRFWIQLNNKVIFYITSFATLFHIHIYRELERFSFG